MALVECLIAIAHAQRVVIHERTVTIDLSVMSQYTARIHTWFINDVKMAERKRSVATSLTTDGSCLTTRISSVYSTATSMFEECGSIKVDKYLFKYIYKGHDRICGYERD
jgi:hypothetical protein